MFHFYTPWKHQKTFGFLNFLGVIEMEHWAKMTLNTPIIVLQHHRRHTCFPKNFEKFSKTRFEWINSG